MVCSLWIAQNAGLDIRSGKSLIKVSRKNDHHLQTVGFRMLLFWRTCLHIGHLVFLARCGCVTYLGLIHIGWIRGIRFALDHGESGSW